MKETLMAMMNIGQASKASGVSAKMIRHYEEIGLFAHPQRTEAGYRLYSAETVHTLTFIRRARDLGFSLEKIQDLVGLWHDRERSSRDVRVMAQEHIAVLETKIEALLTMKATLETLVHCCHGDDRPDCPILASLASETAGNT
jgi:Cu(I)-responsive transcriptional regulator